MQFSLLFFASKDTEFAHNKYQFLLNCSRYADENDFSAIWVPERHFHPFGGLYPNPSILAAALAMVTKRIRLRAGSVVLPLQNPIRVAEEWSVVDNLSNGRVDLAFAQGWNARDFVLAPSSFKNRLTTLYSGLETVKKLWQGEAISMLDGEGQAVSVRMYPQPVQKQFNTWITCSGGIERFVEAGAIGANVLTALLFQSTDELASKIAEYRKSREQHGFDPNSGQVSLMLHTFVGKDLSSVRSIVKEPFTEYLKSSINLWRQQMKKLDSMSPEEEEEVLAYAFERYFDRSALFGTPQSCLKTIKQFEEIGVNEVACLLDFGVSQDILLNHLPYLKELSIVSQVNALI